MQNERWKNIPIEGERVRAPLAKGAEHGQIEQKAGYNASGRNRAGLEPRNSSYVVLRAFSQDQILVFRSCLGSARFHRGQLTPACSPARRSEVRTKVPRCVLFTRSQQSNCVAAEIDVELVHHTP